MRNLKYQFHLIQAIRNFFTEKDFMDVLTPPMVENPGMETHIHPFQVFSPQKNQIQDLYLHSSPEFHMKEILASEEDFKNIFTITYSFRDEPTSEIHRNQFLMLEWYRKNARYEKIMEDVKNLVTYCSKYLNSQNIPVQKIDHFQEATIQEIFQEYVHFDILEFLDPLDLKEKIQRDFKEVPLPSIECSWDDYFFLLFLNKIEPHFTDIPYLLLKEFPTPLAALSTIKENDPRVCERFEVYLSGVELCNCFNESTSAIELRKRFEEQASTKKELYHYSLPWPKTFMNVMENGYPPSSGIALGVERLLHGLTDIKNPFFY